MKISFKPPNRNLARRLETERFVLEPLGMWAAIGLMHRWRADVEMMSAMYPTSAALSMVQWLKRAPIPNNVDRFTYAIVPKAGGPPIGVHGVRLGGREAAASVALSDRAWWGRNVVVEVRTALMQHFFENTPIERFVGSAYTRNPASIFNYQRMGFDHIMTKVGVRNDMTTGKPLDMIYFAMPRQKWNKTLATASADVA